jgi:hypothetical protein
MTAQLFWNVTLFRYGYSSQSFEESDCPQLGKIQQPTIKTSRYCETSVTIDHSTSRLTPGRPETPAALLWEAQVSEMHKNFLSPSFQHQSCKLYKAAVSHCIQQHIFN